MLKAASHRSLMLSSKMLAIIDVQLDESFVKLWTRIYST